MPRAPDAAAVEALIRILTRAATLHAEGRSPRVAIGRAAAAERASLALYRAARAAWAAVVGEHDSQPWTVERALQPRPAEPAAANGPGASAIVDALAEILARAEALRRDGHDSRGAIVRAMKEHRADHALACVAFDAWMLAVGGGEASV